MAEEQAGGILLDEYQGLLAEMGQALVTARANFRLASGRLEGAEKALIEARARITELEAILAKPDVRAKPKAVEEAA